MFPLTETAKAVKNSNDTIIGVLLAISLIVIIIAAIVAIVAIIKLDDK